MTEWLNVASGIVGFEIVWCERVDTEQGRYFNISYDNAGYTAYRPRELRNLSTFQKLFDMPHASATECRRFLAALHNHCDITEKRITNA